jgi:two-component system LytT family response regulator
VDAFELQAVDYLLKPVNRARLQAALERVVERQARASDASRGADARAARAQDQQIDDALRANQLRPMRFLARKGARFRIVPRHEVIAFTVQDGITRLHTATDHFWMQPTLAALARRLDPDTFFQVSRVAIVSLDAVHEAKPFPDGTGEVILTNGQSFAVTRRRWRALMERLGG